VSGDGRAFLKRVALAYGLIVLLMLGVNAGAIAAWRFPDPDDALRLVQVRDWMGGQGWYDLHQYRIDPASGGVMMHWSRLVDVPLAAVMLVLRPVLGAAGAEHAAMLIVPLLTLAMVLMLVARVAWERLGPEAATLSALVLAMSVPVMTQIRPLRIDHHGWQVAAAMLAVQGVMTRHARIGGWVSGGALAVGLSISLEGLPLTVVFGGLGLWRWLRGGEVRLWLVHFARALAVVSAVCFVATRLGDGAQHCDAVAPVHLAVLAWVALGVNGLAPARRRGAQVVGLVVVVGGALALYLGMAPQCRAGSFDMLDPLVRRMWYEGVPEGLPVWQQDAASALQIMIPPLAGLGACIALIRRTTGDEQVWWQEYMLLLAGALAVAMLVARAGAVAGALAAVPLAWGLGCALAVPRGRLMAMAGVVAVLMPSAPITAWGMMGHDTAPFLAQRVSDCRVRQAAAIFDRLPQGTILAPLDIGPELLVATRDSVMATGHHRGARAIHDALLALISPPDQARALIRAHHVRYIALCPDLAQAQGYDAGLASLLIAGHAPVWLERVQGATGEGLQVWQVH